MEDEISGREPVVEQVKATGQQMVENGHYASDTITSRLSNLDNKWASARDTAAYRKRKLQDSLNVQQVGIGTIIHLYPCSSLYLNNLKPIHTMQSSYAIVIQEYKNYLCLMQQF